MKRSAPLARAPMKRGRGNPIPTRVRSAVFLRSKGWCEVGVSRNRLDVTADCYRNTADPAHAQDMHHLVKRPRLHEPWAIVHLCRRHHEMCEAAYYQGRLVFTLPLPVPSAIAWRIERRERKHGRVTELLAAGVIRL